MSNKTKYFSYKEGFSLMKEALGNDKLQYTISAIAVAESIIVDRMYSFLYHFENDWLKDAKGKRNFKPATNLANKIKSLKGKVAIEIDSNIYEELVTENLFEDITEWLINRNSVLHSFARSEPGTPTQDLSDFKELSYKTAREGYKLSRLTVEWFKSQKNAS